MEDHLPNVQLFAIQITDDYFKDIFKFPITGTAPAEYSAKQKKQLVVREADFMINVGQLYKLGLDEVL